MKAKFFAIAKQKKQSKGYTKYNVLPFLGIDQENLKKDVWNNNVKHLHRNDYVKYVLN